MTTRPKVQYLDGTARTCFAAVPGPGVGGPPSGGIFWCGGFAAGGAVSHSPCSPDGAQRNPAGAVPLRGGFPDTAALRPGYVGHRQHPAGPGAVPMPGARAGGRSIAQLSGASAKFARRFLFIKTYDSYVQHFLR